MKWLPTLRVAAGLLFVASIVLGVITMRAMSESRRWGSRASNAIMSFSLADRALQLDLLNARVGLLRNYDPVDADLASESSNLADLKNLQMSPQARLHLGKIRSKVQYQEYLVEQFKSSNALLQNSLTRFTSNRSQDFVARNNLSGRILKLTLDTSPQTVRDATEDLRKMYPARSGGESVQLFAHARLLVTILPKIDELLHAIRIIGVQQDLDDLATILRVESRKSAILVMRLQISLEVAIVLLISVLVGLILAQRLRTRELQMQAANALFSAAIATPLIDTGSADFAARVREVVNHLGFHIGARRLRLMMPDLLGRTQFAWPDGGQDQDWLRPLVEAADADDAWFDDRVLASRDAGGGGLALDAAMAAADIDDLILLRTAEPFQVLLGYEPDGPALAQRRDHLAGVASAIAAIAHGARREVLQLERERLERTLSRARRMETIGAMASGVAHNFNNIIGAIGGFAEMGQEHERRGATASHSLIEIQGAVMRARDLVEDILSFAKQGRSAKMPLNLYDVLGQTVRLVSATVRDKLTFDLVASDTRYPVLGSVSDLQQVFLNVCKNAGQAGAGGAVSISVLRCAVEAEHTLSHGAVDPGDYVVVTISDQGPGISPSAVKRLFEPFFTTKSGGTGLGLSTAWEIVQDHGGTIDVGTATSGGARFSIWLPEAKIKSNVPITGDGMRILLIAEPARLACLEDLLAEMGYEPLGFALSKDAEILRDGVPECGGVLIASVCPILIEKAMTCLGSVLAGRPVLVATPGSRLSCAHVACHVLDYPIDPAELSRLLVEVSANPVGKVLTTHAPPYPGRLETSLH